MNCTAFFEKFRDTFYIYFSEPCIIKKFFLEFCKNLSDIGKLWEKHCINSKKITETVRKFF